MDDSIKTLKDWLLIDLTKNHQTNTCIKNRNEIHIHIHTHIHSWLVSSQSCKVATGVSLHDIWQYDMTLKWSSGEQWVEGLAYGL